MWVEFSKLGGFNLEYFGMFCFPNVPCTSVFVMSSVFPCIGARWFESRIFSGMEFSRREAEDKLIKI